MKFLTREDIDMSVPEDPELVNRRLEARRKIHDEMKKNWADSKNQHMPIQDSMRQCSERVMQEYDEKFKQETQELLRQRREAKKR